MGTFSIILGFIALAGFAGVSFPVSQFAAHEWEGLRSMMPNQFSLPSSQVALIVIAVFVFIGVLFFVPLLTAGLAYNRSKKVEHKLRHRKSQKEQ